jgi:hypothetical protein
MIQLTERVCSKVQFPRDYQAICVRDCVQRQSSRGLLNDLRMNFLIANQNTSAETSI